MSDSFKTAVVCIGAGIGVALLTRHIQSVRDQLKESQAQYAHPGAFTPSTAQVDAKSNITPARHGELKEQLDEITVKITGQQVQDIEDVPEKIYKTLGCSGEQMCKDHSLSASTQATTADIAEVDSDDNLPMEEAVSNVVFPKYYAAHFKACDMSKLYALFQQPAKPASKLPTACTTMDSGSLFAKKPSVGTWLGIVPQTHLRKAVGGKPGPPELSSLTTPRDDGSQIREEAPWEPDIFCIHSNCDDFRMEFIESWVARPIPDFPKRREVQLTALAMAGGDAVRAREIYSTIIQQRIAEVLERQRLRQARRQAAQAVQRTQLPKVPKASSMVLDSGNLFAKKPSVGTWLAAVPVAQLRKASTTSLDNVTQPKVAAPVKDSGSLFAKKPSVGTWLAAVPVAQLRKASTTSLDNVTQPKVAAPVKVQQKLQQQQRSLRQCSSSTSNLKKGGAEDAAKGQKNAVMASGLENMGQRNALNLNATRQSTVGLWCCRRRSKAALQT